MESQEAVLRQRKIVKDKTISQSSQLENIGTSLFTSKVEKPLFSSVTKQTIFSHETKSFSSDSVISQTFPKTCQKSHLGLEKKNQETSSSGETNTLQDKTLECSDNDSGQTRKMIAHVNQNSAMSSKMCSSQSREEKHREENQNECPRVYYLFLFLLTVLSMYTRLFNIEIPDHIW